MSDVLAKLIAVSVIAIGALLFFAAWIALIFVVWGLTGLVIAFFLNMLFNPGLMEWTYQTFPTLVGWSIYQIVPTAFIILGLIRVFVFGKVQVKS